MRGRTGPRHAPASRLVMVALSLVTVALSAVGGCRGIADLDQPYVLGTGSVGVTTGTGGAGGARSCPPETIPAEEPSKPTTATPGGSVRFAVAVDRLEFGEKITGQCDAQALPGFNLDGRVSTEAEPACQPPMCSPSACIKQCDGPSGIDNAFAQLMKDISTLAGVGSVNASEAAVAGEWSLLVEVADYNGELDDDQVTVTMYTTSAYGTPPPTWSGNDDWPIDATSVDPATGMPRFTTTQAWVTCGLLVAPLAEIPLQVHTADAHVGIKMSGGRFVAKVSRDAADRYVLEGAFGGLWKADQVWLDLDSFRTDEGMPICANTGYFLLAKPRLCAALDATSGFASISAPCDALSVGIGFHASPIAPPTRLQEPEPLVGTPCPDGSLPSQNACN